MVHCTNMDSSCTVANHRVGFSAPIGSSYVHVCPRDLFTVFVVVSIRNELLEERCSGVRSTPSSCAKVACVSNLGIGHFLFECWEKWHWPCQFTNGISSLMDFCTEVVVVGPESSRFVTKRNHTGSCEGCKVDNEFRIELASLPKSIRKNQSTFCVGIEDFNGLSRERCDDVAWSLSIRCWHVFCHARDCDHFPVVSGCSQGLHCSKDRCRATHVVLHLIHVRTRLERDTTCIECDSFSNEKRAATGLFFVHFEDDHAWFSRRTHTDCNQTTHACFYCMFVVDDGHFDIVVILCPFPCFIGECLGEHIVWRAVPKVSRKVDTRCNSNVILDKCFQSFFLTLIAGNAYISLCFLVFVLLHFVFIV